VGQVLSEANEEFEIKYRLAAEGFSLTGYQLGGQKGSKIG